MGKQEPKSERPTPVHTSLFVDRHPTVARRSLPDVPTRAEETRAEDRARRRGADLQGGLIQ